MRVLLRLAGAGGEQAEDADAVLQAQEEGSMSDGAMCHGCRRYKCVCELTTEDLDSLPCLLRNMLEANGRTIKQNNMERTHGVPLGCLVELEEGLRLYVVHHGRDCDGTLLYWLGMRRGDEREDWDQKLGGYSEDDLTIVEHAAVV